MTVMKTLHCHVPAEKRWSAQIDKNGPPVVGLGRCWVWQGMLRKGYGRFRVDGKIVTAHRYAWSLFRGPIPNGLGVLHKCDNRRCANPDHLFLGTNVDNNLDMVEKGRQVKVEQNGKSVLTELQAVSIRTRYEPWSPINGCSAMAREFGVSRSAIKDVLSGRCWSHAK